MSVESLKPIRKKYANTLANLPNVISVGIGYKTVKGAKTDTLAIIVGVQIKLPESLLQPQDVVPQDLEGVPTDVVQVGRIEVIPPRAPVPRGKRIRPVKPGYSIGNKEITAGTLGCIVYRDGAPYFLSNAHVFVPDPTKPEAAIHDIIQPGAYDGGTHPEDWVASLKEYAHIQAISSLSECPVSTGLVLALNILSQKILRRESFFWAGASKQIANLIDAAIAIPVTDFELEVEGIGVPTGMVEAELGMPVIKSGRTTEVTVGKVTQVDMTTAVGYGNMNLAVFDDQIAIQGDDEQPFCQGGDSGSVVFQKETSDLCGLLFAGSETENLTIVNRMQNVVDFFGLTF